MEQDWGDSDSGAALAQLRQVHNHRKDERRFQLLVLAIFSAFSLLLVLCQATGAADIVAKDLILTALPVFTFVLGKLESRNE